MFTPKDFEFLTIGLTFLKICDSERELKSVAEILAERLGTIHLTGDERLLDEIDRKFAHDEKIPAVKYCKDKKSCDLKDAKDFVEQLKKFKR